MDKLLIEVYVPAIGSVYDVFIPYKAKVYELTPLIASAVEKLSDGLFVSNDAALCNGNTGTIYHNNISVEEMSLRNGSRLIMI